jgi:hypothetical protein
MKEFFFEEGSLFNGFGVSNKSQLFMKWKASSTIEESIRLVTWSWSVKSWSPLFWYMTLVFIILKWFQTSYLCFGILDKRCLLDMYVLFNKLTSL